MKKIILVAVAVSSLTLFSFVGVGEGSVKLLENGNYYVPEGAVSESDIEKIEEIILDGELPGSAAIEQTLYKIKANEVEWFNEEIWTVLAPNDFSNDDLIKIEKVKGILDKYLETRRKR